MNRLKIELLFCDKNVNAITNIMNKYLKDLFVQGQDKVWIIKKVNCDYTDGTFASINIFPKDYDREEVFIYYEDKKFSNNLAKKIGLDIVVSEQGMQGKDYVNYDLFIKPEEWL